MSKTIFMSLVSFVLGTTLSAMLIANPFHWAFIDPEPAIGSWARVASNFWTCPMHPEVLEEEPGNCPICAMKLTPVKANTIPEATNVNQGQTQLWTCGMHPQVLQEEPGYCPICAMKLTPVKGVSTDAAGVGQDHGDEDSESGLVTIDPTFVQNIGVQTEVVQRTDIPFTIRTVGTTTYDDRQVAWINTKYEGWIEKVYVNYLGESVEKGQELFEIYSPQLVTTQKEYLQALSYASRMSKTDYPEIAQRAKSLVESARQRLHYWGITDAQIQELERSGDVRRTLAVTSPVHGLVVEKMDQALEGMHVTAGMNLYKLVDLSSILVEVEIFENQVSWIRVGQQAKVELPYEPGTLYHGRVRYIYPYFNDKTRTMKASIELPNPQRSLRAEMYVDVTIEVPSASNVVAVPEEALIHSGKRKIVVLDRGSGKFQVQEVQVGVNANGLWEIKEGLEEGDLIVVSSQFLIDSESNLQEAIRKMMARASSSEATTEPQPAHIH